MLGRTVDIRWELFEFINESTTILSALSPSVLYYLSNNSKNPWIY